MLPDSPHSVSPIDENHLLYGNFIELQYAFAGGLDADILARAVAALLSQFPALSGCYDAKQGHIRRADAPVALTRKSHSGKLSDVLAASGRPNFIQEPSRKDVLRGRVALSTFTLTEFSDGGVIFGMAISHVLTDAAGYHLLMRHLGDIYTAISLAITPPDFPFATHLDVFEFGTVRFKSDVLEALKRQGLPKPIPIKGLMGGLIKSLIIKAMDKSIHHNVPTKIHFTPDDVSRLKQSVLTESGEDWISTNVALCAHFTSLMAKLSYGDDIKTEMQIGQLLDLRGRYFEADSAAQSQYVGNAILIHIDKAAFPDGLQNTSRGDLAKYFKQRQAETTADDVKDRLNLLADCLRHGYTNPELDVKNPIISLNNQSKMAVYDVRFAEQQPQQIYPQDVGDNIMFFPAADGGIDIYMRDIVNPQRQEQLLTPDWQTRIFDF
ncbi:acyltransferase [Hellea sp.]|nr:acyltransferase [Hellea sp.]